MAMIKCEKCKKSISDSEKICPYCGEEPKLNFKCPQCNSVNIGIDYKKPSENETAIYVATKKGGLLGGLLANLILKDREPLVHKMIYTCKDCGHQFYNDQKKR